MDAGRADNLAASADPKALNSLRNRGGDPAVARAVAGQFGSFLMQGMMQDADGSAMSMAEGTGSAAVSSMFAGAMSRYAMSNDHLGLADTIYRSMAAHDSPKAETGSGSAKQGAAAETPAPGVAAPATQGSGIALAPYWQLGGHRPFGPPIGHSAPPATKTAPSHSTEATEPSAHATAAPRAAARPATAHVATTSNPVPVAPSAPVHLHLLGRDFTWQSPSDAARVPPSPKTSTGNAPPGPHGATAADSGHNESFPWNIVHWIGRNLAGESASEPRMSGTPLPAIQASTGPATSSANTPSISDAAMRSGETATMPASAPSDHPMPQHVDKGTNSTLLDAEAFAGELAPALHQAAARLGVSPRTLLAQAALETGWGHSVVGNNIFGIKAGGSWHGASVSAKTHEMEGGRLVARRDAFRSYPSLSDAVDDYVSLVTESNRYRAAIGSGDDAAAYGKILAAGGYASDRDYAAKLNAVARSTTMSYAVGAAEDAAAGKRILAHG